MSEGELSRLPVACIGVGDKVVIDGVEAEVLAAAPARIKGRYMYRIETEKGEHELSAAEMVECGYLVPREWKPPAASRTRGRRKK